MLKYMKNMRHQKSLHILHILPCTTVSILLSFLPLPARSHNSDKQAVLFLYSFHNFYNTRYLHPLIQMQAYSFSLGATSLSASPDAPSAFVSFGTYVFLKYRSHKPTEKSSV